MIEYNLLTPKYIRKRVFHSKTNLMKLSRFQISASIYVFSFLFFFLQKIVFVYPVIDKFFLTNALLTFMVSFFCKQPLLFSRKSRVINSLVTVSPNLSFLLYSFFFRRFLLLLKFSIAEIVRNMICL